jgi:hypothetical protein
MYGRACCARSTDEFENPVQIRQWEQPNCFIASDSEALSIGFFPASHTARSPMPNYETKPISNEHHHRYVDPQSGLGLVLLMVWSTAFPRRAVRRMCSSVGSNRSRSFATTGCLLRIGPQFSYPQPTVDYSLERPFPDGRRRRSC